MAEAGTLGGRLRLPLLLAALGLGLALALTQGSVPLGADEVLAALRTGLAGGEQTGSGVIVWELRLPRALMAMLVGAALALCGAAFQGVFRNPLADPYLLGSASGAALGVALAVVLGLAAAALPALALAGALLSVLLTVVVGARGRDFPPVRLILAGVAVGSVVTALTTYLMLQGEGQLRQIFAFTLGNLAFAGWGQLRAVLPYALLGGAALLLLARALNLLQLGDTTARSLGLPPARLRLVVIVAGSLVTAAAVAYAGVIGFVGLVTPHLVRRIWGADHRTLLPLSALAGATLLLHADLLARLLVAPAELPVGVVTTLIGGPFFIYLLRRVP